MQDTGTSGPPQRKLTKPLSQPRPRVCIVAVAGAVDFSNDEVASWIITRSHDLVFWDSAPRKLPVIADPDPKLQDTLSRIPS